MGHKTRLSTPTSRREPLPRAASHRLAETAVRTLILPGRACGCEPGACRPCHDSPPAIRNKAITRRIPPRPDVLRYVRGRGIAAWLPAGCTPSWGGSCALSVVHHRIRTDGFPADRHTTTPLTPLVPAEYRDRRPVPHGRNHSLSPPASVRTPSPVPVPRQWINSAPPAAISGPGRRAWRTDRRAAPARRPPHPQRPVIHRRCPQAVDNDIHWIGPMVVHPAPPATGPATRAATGRGHPELPDPHLQAAKSRSDHPSVS